MIEVEKQCKPSDEQIAAIIRDSEFVGENTDHDIYYDYPDYSLFKKDIRLRYRNDSYELKIEGDYESGISKEIEDETEIARYFNVSDLSAFVSEKLIKIIEYKSLRKKYQNGEFIFMIDQMDFGFTVCEVELMVEKEEDVGFAEEKIRQFAAKYGITLEKVKSKRREYFKRVKPELYTELYS